MIIMIIISAKMNRYVYWEMAEKKNPLRWWLQGLVDSCAPSILRIGVRTPARPSVFIKLIDTSANCEYNRNWAVTGFEPCISGDGSQRSTNLATNSHVTWNIRSSYVISAKLGCSKIYPRHRLQVKRFSENL